MLDNILHFQCYFNKSGRSWISLKHKETIDILHKNYKNGLEKEKKWIRFYQILIFITFFGLWEIAGRREWIDPLLFSSPTKVWNLFITKLNDGTLLSHLSVTLFETILGFI